MGRPKAELAGMRFGRLVAKTFSREPCSSWICICDCGTQRQVQTSKLLGGQQLSCGCFGRELTKSGKRTRTHGQLRSSEYKSWESMRGRCGRLSYAGYEKYGGQGIRVCEQWNSFQQFLKDMGPKPTPSHTIDRKDNSLGYFPENCRWASKAEQVRNRGVTTHVHYKGLTKPLAEWCELLGLDYSRVRQRIQKANWSPEKAFTAPSLRPA